jgi:hypothetical protein
MKGEIAMRRHWLIAATMLVLLVLLAFSAGCGTTALVNRISYQGRLTDAGGNPINGTRNMVFRLYHAESGGSAVWQETQNSVPVTSGLFNVALGSVTPLDEAEFHIPLWLEVVVEGETLARQPLYGSPYAFSLVPGAVIKGYIANTETYSSTLTVANFGTGQALAAISTSGPAVYAKGVGAAILADGTIQSSEKSYLWSSGNSLVKNLSADTTRWDMASNGSATIWRGAATGSKNVYYPITLPSVLYGTSARVTKLTVYYKCADGSKGYIAGTYLRKQTDADSVAVIISDDTNRTSNTATSYTLTLTSNNVLSADQGGLGLWLTLAFADDSNYVMIGGIRLELEYRQ